MHDIHVQDGVAAELFYSRDLTASSISIQEFRAARYFRTNNLTLSRVTLKDLVASVVIFALEDINIATDITVTNSSIGTSCH